MIAFTVAIWLVWLVVAYLVGKASLREFRQATLFLGCLAILCLVGLLSVMWLYPDPGRPEIVNLLFFAAALLYAWFYPLAFWTTSLSGGHPVGAIAIFGVTAALSVATQLWAQKQGTATQIDESCPGYPLKR